MTQDTEDVVAVLHEQLWLAAKIGGTLTPDMSQVDALRAVLTERQSLSDRIDGLEARQHGGEHGTAGDVIDFALDRLTDEREVRAVLDSWRDGTVGILCPDYIEWLAVQRAGAADARAALHQEGISAK